MSHQKKDVAHEPTPDLFEPAHTDREDYDPMDIGGPGGKTTNLEHNEKGILEEGLFRVMATNPKTAELGKNRGNRQGIYTTNHRGA